jgi:hypothetical protein
MERDNARAPHHKHGTERDPLFTQARADLGDRGETFGVAYAWDARANTYNTVRLYASAPDRVTRYMVAERPHGRERTVPRMVAGVRASRTFERDTHTYVRTTHGVYVEQHADGRTARWVRAPRKRDARADAERASVYARRWADCLRAAGYQAHVCPRDKRERSDRNVYAYGSHARVTLLTPPAARALARLSVLGASSTPEARADRARTMADVEARIAARERKG